MNQTANFDVKFERAISRFGYAFGFTMYKWLRRFLIYTIFMKSDARPERRMLVLFHTMGLSCLGGAIFLQLLVFTDILQHGYFIAVENNPAILSLEVLLTAFSAIYFAYIYQHFIRSMR